MKQKRIFAAAVLILLTAFFYHRFTRTLTFFEVTEEFERPMEMTVPEGLSSLSAEECALCHEDIYNEWKSSIMAQAWTEPYFQVDFVWDNSMQVCKNCHTPLADQQEYLVLGFNDSAKLDPILEPNPNYDPSLQNEGVTCVVCHVKDGVILGPYDLKTDAHPTRKDDRFTDGNSVCKRCHWVKGDRWDMFLKLPPCGNFAEIEETGKKVNCVKCHMPRVTRAMATGGPVRNGGRHLWRGGHDPKMVKSAAKIELTEEADSTPEKRRYTLSVTNVGTEHRLPTGTPDRHLEVSFRLYDADGKLIKKKRHFLERIILWRPFMVDLRDTRLKYQQTRSYSFNFSTNSNPKPALLVAEVRYGLLHESRRKRIGYKNKKPIKYSIFQKKIPL
ncbi:MAG: hypothetical protein ACE5EN_07500 [Nitrospinota bacterium]